MVESGSEVFYTRIWSVKTRQLDYTKEISQGIDSVKYKIKRLSIGIDSVRHTTQIVHRHSVRHKI